jgi:environmental stress-induced protein Ves
VRAAPSCLPRTAARLAVMTGNTPAVRVVPAGDCRRVRWKNNAGWTREICACRLDGRDGVQAQEWDWRLSIAEIEADAPFSSFPGVERELVLLSGNGLRLRFDDGECHELLPPYQRLRFSGERALVGELVDGPTEDLNLMWRRGTVEATLWHRPLVGAMVAFVEPGETWAMHLLAGGATVGGDAHPLRLARGDTLLLRGGTGERMRHVIDGGGEMLLVRIAARGRAPFAA